LIIISLKVLTKRKVVNNWIKLKVTFLQEHKISSNCVLEEKIKNRMQREKLLPYKYM